MGVPFVFKGGERVDRFRLELHLLDQFDWSVFEAFLLRD